MITNSAKRFGRYGSKARVKSQMRKRRRKFERTSPEDETLPNNRCSREQVPTDWMNTVTQQNQSPGNFRTCWGQSSVLHPFTGRKTHYVQKLKYWKTLQYLSSNTGSKK
jgi:hypothetical protein